MDLPWKTTRLTLRTEKSHNTQNDRGLALGTGQIAAAIEERLIRPVAAVFQPRQQTFHHLVLTCQGELLHLLRHSGFKSVSVVEVFKTGSNGPRAVRSKPGCDSDAAPGVAALG